MKSMKVNPARFASRHPVLAKTGRVAGKLLLKTGISAAAAATIYYTPEALDILDTFDPGKYPSLLIGAGIGFGKPANPWVWLGTFLAGLAGLGFKALFTVFPILSIAAAIKARGSAKQEIAPKGDKRCPKILA